jgi:hypothetical protein
LRGREGREVVHAAQDMTTSTHSRPNLIYK